MRQSDAPLAYHQAPSLSLSLSLSLACFSKFRSADLTRQCGTGGRLARFAVRLAGGDSYWIDYLSDKHSKPPVWGEANLRLAIEAAGVALWSWNVDTVTVD